MDLVQLDVVRNHFARHRHRSRAPSRRSSGSTPRSRSSGRASARSSPAAPMQKRRSSYRAASMPRNLSLSLSLYRFLAQTLTLALSQPDRGPVTGGQGSGGGSAAPRRAKDGAVQPRVGQCCRHESRPRRFPLLHTEQERGNVQRDDGEGGRNEPHRRGFAPHHVLCR